MEFVPRRSIGPFEIAAHLDSGGMADVYLARGPKPKSMLVIKVLREHLKGEAEVVSMFRAEGRLMVGLQHPNVVHVIDHGEEQGCPYIAMEYLPGDHVGVAIRAARRHEAPITPTLTARIAMQAAAGLAYVHSARDRHGRPLQLVHRDISPQNIFLCYDGRVKILDFGIALTADRDVVTRTGMLKGKVSYMSPEQIRRREIDGRSDLFALGIVMWEMICGKRLFKLDNEYDVLQKILEEDAPSLLLMRRDATRALSDIVARCLERDAKKRFADAAGLQAALAAFVESQAAPADEVEAFIACTLDKRQQMKQGIIDSLIRQDALQMRLFGDLGDDLGSSGSIELDFEMEPRTDASLSAPRETDPFVPSFRPADADSGSVLPTPSTPTRTRAPRSGRTGLLVWLVAAVVLMGAAIVAGTWYLLREERAPNARAADEPAPTRPAPTQPVAELPRPAPPAEPPPAPDRTYPGPSGIVSTQRPYKSRTTGALHLDCSPGAMVFIDGKAAGMTPIERKKLPPGAYRVMLKDPVSGEVKAMSVQISKSRLSDYQVAF
ncbi:MAG: protein kinase [Deltaproteobacteria bacterium]|nr:protein kinase [Deltaproteobacteria bacterium]